MDSAITAFITRLSAIPSTHRYANPWDALDPHAAVRRDNLRLYLAELAARQPDTMLVGEAPGYLGARRTGICFTSTDLMLRGVPALGLLGQEKGYRVTPEFGPSRKEQSATIVWGALEQFGLTALLWAAFPFHPHKPNAPLTNRPPAVAEVESGRSFLLELRDLFGIERVIAVGNVAHRSLAAAGIDAPKIRHPAQGGKRQFIEGLAQLVGPPSPPVET